MSSAHSHDAATASTLGVGSRVKHPIYGKGVVTRVHQLAYEVTFVDAGTKPVGKNYRDWEIVEAIESEGDVSFTEAERSLLRLLRTYNAVDTTVQLGGRWDKGTLILRPGEPGLKNKEMPIEDFFHKIVMVRDRLRVMEQRINASALSDEEKVNLQQYVTRIYGSLTSFNALFARKDDHFVGSASR